MTLLMTCATILVTAHLIAAWRAVRITEIRWRYYALRDQLRWAAINDDAVRRASLFAEMDASLTGHGTYSNDVSLWSMLPLLLDKEWRATSAKLAEEHRRQLLAEPATFSAIQRDVERVTRDLMVAQHPVIAVAVWCGLQLRALAVPGAQARNLQWVAAMALLVRC